VHAALVPRLRGDERDGFAWERFVLSECARAATAEEARFRVDYPNSVPRRIKVIALDRPAERLVRRLAQKEWNCATFLTTASEETSRSVRDWLSTLAGEAVNLLEQIGAADLVVTVSTAGESADDAAVIADACDIHRVMLTSLLIDPTSTSEPVLPRTMMPLRAHASMLVVAKGEEYVDSMLTALRA
jgi:hypothetical protein